MLPLELKELLDLSYTKMIQEPKNILPPFYRKKIYDFILNNIKPAAYYWLSIITVEYLLPLWESKWPNNALPKQLLDIATQTIVGNISREVVKEKFENGWKEKEKLGTDNAEMGKEFYVFEGAVEALHDVLGKAPFGGVEIKEFDTDENDLDYTCEDTASSAMVTLAGETGDRNFSTEKSKEFWEWWLTEAVSKAWEKALP